MRLPADATLIVVGVPPPAAAASRTVPALLDAWRREDLPVVSVAGPGVFANGQLEALLDESGATTLVLCGEGVAVEAAARDAAALGFHVFVVLDACWDLGAPTAIARSGGAGIPVDAATALSAAALAKARARREALRAR